MARIPLLVTVALISVPFATPVYAQHGTPTSHGSTTHGSTHATGAKSDTAATKSKTVTAQAGTSRPDATSRPDGGSTTTPTGGTTQLTPVQAKLMRNTNLANKLQSRLPAGTNLQTAASGFRNLGQFVAAVNVSNNLGIPFDRLKADMVTKNMSLGQSIQDVKHSRSGNVRADVAEVEARVLIAQTESTTATSTAKKKTMKTTTRN
jgi:hypothetical protein